MQISGSIKARVIRNVLHFVLLAAGTLLVFFPLRIPAKTGQRTLTFAERVAYQRAIEDVYWRHRIWPKERPDPKPPLHAVMSQTQLQKKVTDYLRKSKALEDYWQRPITAEQLQAEMDRMAKHTKQPEVLQELFKALGNDPLVIAECLAKPALAERLLSSWYAYDERIHGKLKQRAQRELQAHSSVEGMKRLSGNYSEIELVKSANGKSEASHGTQRSMNSHEWDDTLRKLAAMFSGRPVRERMSREGADPVGSTPDEFSVRVTSEIAKWAKVVKDAGIASN